MKEGSKTTKSFAIAALSELGLNEAQIKTFTKGMSIKGFSAIANFKIACQFFSLPVAWGDEQIKVFLIYVNYKFYTSGYLYRQWKTIKELGEMLGCPVTEQHEADFELVQLQAREIKDNKVPVSFNLLNQLCDAAEILFQDYNAILAQALFIAAWGGYMRISEYSRTSAKSGNQHNIRRNALVTSSSGISLTFHSDKTSHANDPMKHRFIPWRRLPRRARRVFRQYDILRPKLAYNYFCREDGVKLTRSYVVNLLDACLMLTTYRNLSITPHSFRLGAASHDRARGLSITEVEDRGRWKPKSKAMEAYMRPDVVVLDPEDIFDRMPHYRRFWTHQRLVFIARYVVEKGSDLSQHPFDQVMHDYYPEIFIQHGHQMPQVYPDEGALDRLATIKQAREEGTYLNLLTEAERKRERSKHARGVVANRLRRDARKRIKKSSLPFAYKRHSALKVGFKENTQSQTDAVETVSVECQADPVIILTTEEFQQVKATGVVPLVGECLPDRVPLTKQVAYATAPIPLYEVKSMGASLALTRQEMKERRRADPEAVVSKATLSSKERFLLRCKIRRRICPSYRDRRNNSRIKKRGKKKARAKDKSSSVIKLIEYFMEEIKHKGEAGLPAYREKKDPQSTDDEYEQEVIQAYLDKPVNYEQILKIKLHSRKQGGDIPVEGDTMQLESDQSSISDVSSDEEERTEPCSSSKEQIDSAQVQPKQKPSRPGRMVARGKTEGFYAESQSEDNSSISVIPESEGYSPILLGSDEQSSQDSEVKFKL